MKPHTRREFIRSTVKLAAIAAAPKPLFAATDAVAAPAAVEVEETAILDLQSGLAAGKFTARALAEEYLRRIEALDRKGPALQSVIELNPDALQIADALDRERRDRGARGPLHGIPILIKDNIDTGDCMLTTAGSLALATSPAPRDSFVAEKLRSAGAVILGKTNLSEWANFRSSDSTSGWSGRGGLTRNPYALNRNTSGSSSGSGAATAASLCAASIGTETDGSIVSPSTTCGLVGIKPTLGLVSRAGIIPIAHSQDTAGPMTRTVTDAAILLGALAGADPRDPITQEPRARSMTDYTPFLDPNGLRGARIGVARAYFGFHERTDRLIEAALADLKKLGAELIDPADIPNEEGPDRYELEFEVLLYEFKADLNAYLATRGTGVAARTLKELIEFNERNHEKEMPYFGQDLFIKAEAKGPLTEQKYLDAVATNLRKTRAEGIDFIMDKHRLDAMVAPSGSPAWMTDVVNGDHFTGGYSSASAIAGYPHITVPAGFVSGLPCGISFFGRAFSEPLLLKLAFAYEQATKHRRPPRYPAGV
jgi:amidase